MAEGIIDIPLAKVRREARATEQISTSGILSRNKPVLVTLSGKIGEPRQRCGSYKPPVSIQPSNLPICSVESNTRSTSAEAWRADANSVMRAMKAETHPAPHLRSLRTVCRAVSRNRLRFCWYGRTRCSRLLPQHGTAKPRSSR